ncbi:MAG: hypothetical protein ACRDYB_06665 [Acidimicrobiales bacterium]
MTDTDHDAGNQPLDVEVHGTHRAHRPWVPYAALGAALILLGVVLGVVLSQPGSGPSVGPEGVALEDVPNLAPATTTTPGTPVDGITCRPSTNQKIRYHIHVHVAIFVNGQERRIPAGTGIPAPQLHEHLSTGLFVDNGVGGCLYWLHVHSDDGVIHVESPSKAVFTLGEFFDIWQQPLGPHQVGPARGTVVAYVNGKRFIGNPRAIPLLAHAVVQLDVGLPIVAFQPVQFHVKGLCGSGTQGCAVPG